MLERPRERDIREEPSRVRTNLKHKLWELSLQRSLDLIEFISLCPQGQFEKVE